MPFVWLPETAGMLTSLLLLYILYSLLIFYERRPVFEWKGITLNTVVSVISTASKAALLYSTSQLISQWKWILFTRASRPLLDFERIDAASRGPMGSLMLIWRWRTIGYLYLGALVMLLSIAAESFTQQLIQYDQRLVFVADANTTVNRAGRFHKGSREYKYSKDMENFTMLDSVIVDADLSMQSAVLYGLDRSITNVVQQNKFSCATGNCKWPTFESLAVCNRCTDISSSIQRLISNGSQFPTPGNSGILGTAFRIPSGLYITSWDHQRPSRGRFLKGSIMLATLGTRKMSHTSIRPEVDALIWSMSMIHADENNTDIMAFWPNFPISAIDCILYYCVKSHDIVVSNGIFQEHSKEVAGGTRVMDSWKITPDAYYYSNGNLSEESVNRLSESKVNSIAFDEVFSTLTRSDLALLSPTTGSRFNISQHAVDSISHHFQSMFAYATNYFDIGEAPPMIGRFNGYCERSGNECEPSVMQALLTSTDLNATFTALAASMSNALRTGADESFERISINMTGERGDKITYYRIVWPWICLHCLSVIVGAVFLGVTICENWRQGRRMAPLWKSSSLAIATHCDVVADVLSGVQTVKEMREKAGAARVMLAEPSGRGSSSQELLRLSSLEDVPVS